MRSLWNKVKRVKEEGFKGKTLNDTKKYGEEWWSRKLL